MDDELIEVRAKPFVRWVGGKSKLVPELLKYVPASYGTYHECFLGGGALFFALQPKHAVLSDANAELIHAYTVIRDQPAALIKVLQEAACAHSKEHYYSMRARDPRTLDPVTRAAWLLYLNSTCFNGLWRVNSKGGFNVPLDPGRSGAVNEYVITRASEALRGHSLHAHDFRLIEHATAPGDLVYCDPPYIPLSTTSNFTNYAAGGFAYKDQIDLRDLALRLKRKGVHVLLSNSGTGAVRALYQDHFELIPVQARRNVNCKGDKRGPVGEFIIR